MIHAQYFALINLNIYIHETYMLKTVSPFLLILVDLSGHVTCEVDNLPGRRDALHHDQEDNDPGTDEAEQGPVLDATKGIDAV